MLFLVCGNKGTSNSMLSHLIGRNHKKKVAIKKDPRYSNMRGPALDEFALTFSQNDQELSKLIKTVQSDTAYPWPAGKNPRGRERGGSGEMELEDRGGATGGRKRGREESQERKGFGRGAVVDVKLPHPDAVEKPRTREEAEEMIEMGRRLFDLVMGSEFPRLDQRQKENLSRVVEKSLSHGPRP